MPETLLATIRDVLSEVSYPFVSAKALDRMNSGRKAGVKTPYQLGIFVSILTLVQSVPLVRIDDQRYGLCFKLLGCYSGWLYRVHRNTRYSSITKLATNTSPCILYADDNIQLGSVLQIGLGRYGLGVVTACNGTDALKQFAANAGDFAAIVTDHDMPHMNGHELVRSVRALGFKGLIVVVSSRLSAENLLIYQNQGITCFLHKPFDLAKLAKILLQD